MKLLYFHQHFSTPKGAAGTRSYEMARRLIALGHDVVMVCGSYNSASTGLIGSFKNGKREGLVDGITVIELDLAYSNADGLLKRSWSFLRFSLSSIKIAMTLSYDIVFATTTPLTAGIPGIIARCLRGKPFVFEVRDLWPELPKAMGVINNPLILWLMSILEWMSYHMANRCIGLSPGIVRGIEKRGVHQGKITLIPNGCDFEIFANSVKPWRPEKVANSDFMAIFTGTHGVANGLDAVVDAAIELQRRGREDIKLVLVGDGKLKPVHMSRAKESGLNNLIFLNPINKEKLAGLMVSADIGMQILANIPAFYYGTSPNKFFDYIAAGLPVLNNYPGWLADMIMEYNCGYVVPPDDPVSFVDALEMAAADRLGLKKKAMEAKKLAQTQFDREILANRWVEWVTGVKWS